MRTEQQTAFDLWLHGVLTHKFGPADDEGLPEELLQLLPPDESGSGN